MDAMVEDDLLEYRGGSNWYCQFALQDECERTIEEVVIA